MNAENDVMPDRPVGDPAEVLARALNHQRTPVVQWENCTDNWRSEKRAQAALTLAALAEAGFVVVPPGWSAVQLEVGDSVTGRPDGDLPARLRAFADPAQGPHHKATRDRTMDEAADAIDALRAENERLACGGRAQAEQESKP